MAQLAECQPCLPLTEEFLGIHMSSRVMWTIAQHLGLTTSGILSKRYKKCHARLNNCSSSGLKATANPTLCKELFISIKERIMNKLMQMINARSDNILFQPSPFPKSFSCALVRTSLYKSSACLYFPCFRKAEALKSKSK